LESVGSTTQVPVQLVVEVPLGVAVRVTVEFSLKFAEHGLLLLVQFVIPAGLLATDPEPVTVVVRERGVVVAVKVAIQFFAALIIIEAIVAVPAPLQSSVQLTVKPIAGVAVKVTAVLSLKFAVHIVPPLLVQFVIPAGVLVTVPEPLTVTPSERCVAAVPVTVTLESFQPPPRCHHLPKHRDESKLHLYLLSLDLSC